MINVLTDVVLIQSNRAIGRDGKILRIDQIVFNRLAAAVFKLNLPTPGRTIVRQNQLQLVTESLELPLRHKVLLMHPKATGTVRSQKRRNPGGLPPASKKKICRSAFNLITGKKIDDNVLVCKAPDRPVPVNLDREPFGVLHTIRRDLWVHGHGLTPEGFGTLLNRWHESARQNVRTNHHSLFFIRRSPLEEATQTRRAAIINPLSARQPWLSVKFFCFKKRSHPDRRSISLRIRQLARPDSSRREPQSSGLIELKPLI